MKIILNDDITIEADSAAEAAEFLKAIRSDIIKKKAPDRTLPTGRRKPGGKKRVKKKERPQPWTDEENQLIVDNLNGDMKYLLTHPILRKRTTIAIRSRVASIKNKNVRGVDKKLAKELKEQGIW